MTGDAPELPARIPEIPAEAGSEPAPSDDRFAARLRGFGPLGILAILLILFTGNVDLGKMVILPVGAILVLAWARLSRTPGQELGYVRLRPKGWIVTVTVGIVFGITFKFVMKALVMPLLGADPINQAYHFLAGNPALVPAALFSMITAAGFGEETVFRGYLFERFGRVFGSSIGAKVAIVLITSVWFGLAHYSVQGLAGAEQATIVGLVFGTIFAVTGRIWMLICAHAAFDLTAYAIIYWNLESDVAHLVFR